MNNECYSPETVINYEVVTPRIDFKEDNQVYTVIAMLLTNWNRVLNLLPQLSNIDA